MTNDNYQIVYNKKTTIIDLSSYGGYYTGRKTATSTENLHCPYS